MENKIDGSDDGGGDNDKTHHENANVHGAVLCRPRHFSKLLKALDEILFNLAEIHMVFPLKKAAEPSIKLPYVPLPRKRFF